LKLLFGGNYANNWQNGGRPRKMTARDTLIFLGRRWPGVRAIEKKIMLGQWVRKSAPAQPYFAKFGFVARGDGQRWDADRPMAFWRNFAAIDLTDTAEALRFIARHGDPLGYLDREPGRPDLPRGGTSQPWLALMDALDRIADAWDPPDPNDISFISDDRGRLEGAQRALLELAPPDESGLPEVEWIAHGRGLVPRAQTLRAFMVASAASALRRGVAMKKCAYCADWFELRRTDAFYCSGSCQAADYKQRAMAQGTTVLEMASHRKKGRPHGERT
jgi:hypothetical protein